MKIMAFNGSPRGANGNTYIMVEEFLAGAQAAGAQVEHVLLAGKEINYCKGCMSCWIKTPGQCVIHDDMAELGAKMLGNDIVIFATPLYVDNVTGLFKTFLDRSIFLGSPYFDKDANGETVHKSKIAQSGKIVVISNCGFPEQTHFQVISHYFKRVARNFHSEVIAEIYRGEGALLRVNNIFLAPVLNSYKKLLRTAGQEIVANFKLSDETKAQLEKPLIPYDKYLEEATKKWDKELAKLNNS
jgi:multimeric flavodoxin WrbA